MGLFDFFKKKSDTPQIPPAPQQPATPPSDMGAGMGASMQTPPVAAPTPQPGQDVMGSAPTNTMPGATPTSPSSMPPATPMPGVTSTPPAATPPMPTTPPVTPGLNPTPSVNDDPNRNPGQTPQGPTQPPQPLA